MLLAISSERLLELLALFAAPFLHEGVALVAGAAYVTDGDLSWSLALMCLFGGIVASDLAIFGLGSLARHVPRLRHAVVGEKVGLAREWVSDYLVPIIAACRVLPGVLFPTFIACGWVGVSFVRFVVLSIVTAAIYAPIMLYIMIRFGETFLSGMTSWSWVVLGGAVLGLGALGATRPGWEALSKTASNWRAIGRRAVANGCATIARVSHQGMPALGLLRRKVAAAEHVPPFLYYVPLIAQWHWLGLRFGSMSLPTVANPCIEAGGYWGESKSACMRLMASDARKWLADFVTIRGAVSPDCVANSMAEAKSALSEAAIAFPVVAKPDIGWQGYGVQLIHDEEELRKYIASFPAGETIILQRYLPFDGEAGVFYVRRPGEEHGRVTSLTLRYYPYVAGDGETTVAQLILRDPRAGWKASNYLGANPRHRGLPAETLNAIPAKGEIVRLTFIGSIRVGGLYRDAHEYITPALAHRIDEIAKAIPEFYVGRFDIRFRSIEALQAGDEFSIFEINGAGSEAIHIWDPDMPLLETYKILFRQQRLLFEIGAANRARGFAPMPYWRFIGSLRKQNRLIDRYPRSE
jgi:membrane protein DedA with SNARE-associated domain